MKPVLVHISNDYPDILVPQKTRAVINLVEGTPQYRHVVYSLNRVSALGGLADISFGEDRTAIAYGALPKGIFWEKRLCEVASWIANDLRKKGIKPDLVEAHKFTIEGLIGQDLAHEFSCPLVCDIQGYTDINILQKKKSLRTRYKEIAKECAAVFPYAPWPLEAFERLADLNPEKCKCLPVVPFVDAMGKAPLVEEEKLLSVFHLDGWKNKNFEGIALAVKRLLPRRPKLVLDVYGGGSPKTLLALRKIIDENKLNEHVRLLGPVANGALPDIMRGYAGFVMPSKSESYGLVYIEALFSGVPILLNAKRGISGYFDLSETGYGCDAHDVTDIAKGMEHLLDHQAQLKLKIEKMQSEGAFEFMRKSEILKTYSNTIDAILEKNKNAQA